MNKNLLPALLFGALTVLSFPACSTMDINTKQNPQVNLGNYRTYAWAPAAADEAGTIAPERKELLVKTLQQEVDQQLAAKGYEKTSPDQADFLVAYSATTLDKIAFRTSPYPTIYDGVDVYGPGYAETYREGQLTLDFLDPKTKEIIWEGVATDALGESGGTQGQIADAVQELIEVFPAV